MDLPFSLSEPKALLLLLTLPVVIGLGLLSARARPRDKGRISTSIVVRSLILLLITLALAGLQWITSGGPLNVVFLIDESASVSQESQQAAIDYVQKAIASMGPEDRAGVVLFGERAIVDRALSPDTQWKPFGKQPGQVATNIAEAIQVGTALFPEGGSRRLVLLSDGQETAGQARDAARSAGLTGVQLSVVPLGAQSRNEVAVDKVLSPDSVPGGQQFSVQVVLRSTSERTATVSLSDEVELIGRQEIQLKVGDNGVTFQVDGRGQGFHVFTAQVSSVDDQYSQNNQASSFTIVQRPPTVLIVAGTPDDGAPLKSALASSRVDATVVSPDGMPLEMAKLLDYDAVVLANVSSQALGADAQTMLQSYVRDQGRGLIMLGGELSYGAGGYMQSPIEQVLPVSMDVRASNQRASLALAFVMDKSGSMARCHAGGATQFEPTMRTEFGVSKVEVAKLAIEKAAAVLNSSDQVGVETFDTSPQWLVPMQALSNIGVQGITQNIDPVQAEGNTDLYSGLQAAIAQLSQTNATIKHIILISDGWTDQVDFSALFTQMDQDSITLSTVGAGQGPGQLLQELAQKGGGRYYAAQDDRDIPDIVLRETVRLAGSYYVEQPFVPLVARQSPILNGLDLKAMPQLLGYNGSTIKPSADLILKSPLGDPILAEWQYGLGRSVAWTPDVKGRWATNWIRWPQFSQFAGQMIGWVLPKTSAPGLETSFEAVAGGVGIAQNYDARIQSVDSTGAPRNFLQTTIVLTGTASQPISSTLLQKAPGVYDGLLRNLQQGVYQVQISQTNPISGSLVASQQTGLVVPYPSEYRLSPDAALNAQALLSDLAQLGNGVELDVNEPAAAFRHDITSQPRRVPLWPWLLAIAILLLPLDVAIRRLTFTWSDARRLLGRGGRRAT